VTEIRYRDKRTGRTVVYETTRVTDPVTGEAVRGRRYLGMIDDETGELVPTLGRRGRRPGSRNRPKAAAAAGAAPAKAPDAAPASDLEAENRELRERVRELEARLGEYREAVRVAGEALGGLG